MATSPLVPSVGPLIQSLQQFTPRAREDRSLQLAGFERQAGIEEEQLRQLQISNRRQQMLNVAEENRTALLEDQSDLKFVLKDGPTGLRNNIAQLAARKETDSPDIAELVDFANRATKDPELTFSELTSNQEVIGNNISVVDAILQRTKQRPGFTLKPGEIRFGPGGQEIARVDATAGAQRPEALVAGLPENVQAQAIEAFNLAGGGDKGVKALQKAVETGRAQVRREEIPQTLAASFPNASPAELQQLEATALAGKTPESGLKSAEKVRSEQRRLKKAQSFQSRALQLIDRILANPELNDVIGSFEGRIDFLSATSDAESEAIADIEEAQNILTAENMDLMTGVLSESDLQLLKNLSSGALNRTRGEVRFRKDAQTLRDKLSSQLVQTVDDTSKERLVFDPATGQLTPK